jgi:hypothetical protein
MYGLMNGVTEKRQIPQLCYFDGTEAINDKNLEYIQFVIEVVENDEGVGELVCTGLKSEYDDQSVTAWINSFPDEQINSWKEQVINHITETGDAGWINGEDVYYVELDSECTE